MDPIQFGSQRIESITYQPVTGAMIRHLPMTNIGPDGKPSFTPNYMMEVGSACSGHPPQVFDKMSGRDVNRLVVLLSGRMGPT